VEDALIVHNSWGPSKKPELKIPLKETGLVLRKVEVLTIDHVSPGFDYSYDHRDAKYDPFIKMIES
jgi:hypothetical protein